MKKFLFLLFLVAYSIITYAQDVIITKDSVRIEAQISEISDSEVKFKRLDNLDGPVFVLSAQKVASIVLANGEVFSFPSSTENIQSPEPHDESLVMNTSAQNPKIIEYIPGQQLTIKGSDYYYNETKLTKKEIADLLSQNCDNAYKKYKQSVLSLAFAQGFFCGEVLCLGASTIMYLATKKISTTAISFLIIAAACQLAWPICAIVWNTQINKSATQFNQNCSNREKASTSVSFYMGLTGTGVSINF